MPDTGRRAAGADLRSQSQPVLAAAAGRPAGRLLVVVGLAHPNSAGSALRCTPASSSSGTTNRPLTSSAAPPVTPSATVGTPACSHRDASSDSAPERTATTARAADSLNRNVAGSPGSAIVQPVPPARHDSANATARPPSDRSWAAT